MELKQEDDKMERKAGSGKRGRGRPRGSVNKTIIIVKEVVPNFRESKKIDFFSSGTSLNQKVKKRGRPKKIKIPGRPRKIPLTPEEEAERISRFNRKRKISKPLGRPRIHTTKVVPKSTRGRGRPPKFESSASQKGTKDKNTITDLGENGTRRRGRPPGSLNKKLGAHLVKRKSEPSSPSGSGVIPEVVVELNWSPPKRGRPRSSGPKVDFGKQADGPSRKRGRPPGSSKKVNVVKQNSDGTPRKRGRPLGSGTNLKVPQKANGTPRKRGRPLGSGKKKTEEQQDDEQTDFSSNSAFCISDQPRKRGRPSKSSLTEASKDDNFSPKQRRNSFTYENNAGHDEDPECVDNDKWLLTESSKNQITSRKVVSSRKFPKKK